MNQLIDFRELHPISGRFAFTAHDGFEDQPLVCHLSGNSHPGQTFVITDDNRPIERFGRLGLDDPAVALRPRQPILSVFDKPVHTGSRRNLIKFTQCISAKPTIRIKILVFSLRRCRGRGIRCHGRNRSRERKQNKQQVAENPQNFHARSSFGGLIILL